MLLKHVLLLNLHLLLLLLSLSLLLNLSLLLRVRVHVGLLIRPQFTKVLLLLRDLFLALVVGGHLLAVHGLLLLGHGGEVRLLLLEAVLEHGELLLLGIELRLDHTEVYLVGLRRLHLLPRRHRRRRLSPGLHRRRLRLHLRRRRRLLLQVLLLPLRPLPVAPVAAHGGLPRVPASEARRKEELVRAKRAGRRRSCERSSLLAGCVDA